MRLVPSSKGALVDSTSAMDCLEMLSLRHACTTAFLTCWQCPYSGLPLIFLQRCGKIPLMSEKCCLLKILIRSECSSLTTTPPSCTEGIVRWRECLFENLWDHSNSKDANSRNTAILSCCLVVIVMNMIMLLTVIRGSNVANVFCKEHKMLCLLTRVVYISYCIWSCLLHERFELS